MPGAARRYLPDITDRPPPRGWPWSGLAVLSLLVCACSSGEPTAPRVEPTGNLTGTLSSDWWGAPAVVPAVEVRLSGASSASTTSDADGVYRFDHIAPGAYTLVVEGGRFHTGLTVPASIAANATDTVDLVLSRGSTRLEGSALNRFDGSAYPWTVAIALEPEGRDTVASALTDSLGRFVVTLPMGRYAARFSDATGRRLYDFGADSALELTEPISGLVVRLLPMMEGGLSIDFESPDLAQGEWNRTISPFAHIETGTWFSPVQPSSGASYTLVTGLVINAFTSACVPPADRDQKLATGVSGSGASGSSSSVGFSAGAIRADFQGWLPVGTIVQAELQSGATATGRIHLLDAAGNEVAMVAESLGPPIGTCVEGRMDAGRTVVSGTVGVPTSSVIFDVVPPTGSPGLVWVMDDVVVRLASPAASTTIPNPDRFGWSDPGRRDP